MLVSGKIEDFRQPLSLYFHIPFCSRKCPYCHFFVLPDEPYLKETFLTALELDWKFHLEQIADKRIVSIYFGGGTPTLLGASAIGSILSWVKSAPCTVDPECEITIEANPENLTLPLAESYREIGVNRLSIGVQSLDDALLKILNRTHDAQTAYRAIENGKAAGFSNISIDLMYDLPKQHLSSWKSTLSQAIQLPITHLSLYNLTIEPETVFFKKKAALTPLLPTQETSLQMLEAATQTLEEAGLERYEISAFAQPGFQSRHNTGYWTGRPFLGYGPSAFSYFGGRRFRKTPHLNRYKLALEKGEAAIDFEEALPFPANVHELLAVGLRLLEGVNLDTFQNIHGALPQHTFHMLDSLSRKAWLQTDHAQIRLTPDGLLFYDSVAEALI